MPRPVWCRFCGTPDVMHAGKWPPACAECGGVGYWSASVPVVYVEPKKHAKRARVKMDLTALDRKLLQRLRIAAI